jgi:hypothetical protein
MYRNWMRWATFIPYLEASLMRSSMKIIFQDYNLLASQQQRLSDNANPWNAAIQVDCAPLMYRRYWRKTYAVGLSTLGCVPDEGDAEGPATTLSATLVDSRSGPWWRGWDGKRTDVEDLGLGGYDCNGCYVDVQPFHPQNPFPHVLAVSPAEQDLAKLEVRIWRMLVMSALVGAAVVTVRALRS